MKKHNEGYTLPFVMVVLVVVSMVAVTIMTDAMQTLRTQERIIAQMQAQYEAQGEIEKIIARLEHLETTEAVEIPVLDDLSYEDGKIKGNIYMDSSDGTVRIACGVEISADAIEQEPGTNKFKLSGKPSITYTSYEITTIGGDG